MFEIDLTYFESIKPGVWENLYKNGSEDRTEQKYKIEVENIKECIRKSRLSNGQVRTLAWLLLLNINSDQVNSTYYACLLENANDLTKSSIRDFQI